MRKNEEEMKQTISVVMCTYNGARYLRKQLDTITNQTLPPSEIIVQDDGSSDETLDILHEYADRYPYIRVYKNEAGRGINNNFFSAMRRATGDLIAISDQDDLWLPDKLEATAAGLGDHLMCVGRNEPFTLRDGREVTLHYDRRKPNCDLIRLLYASMPGHCMLFRRELLDLLPADLQSLPIYSHTWYDVILATAAGALDSIVLIDKIVARQRRLPSAASYAAYDTTRTRSANNAVSMVWYGLRHYRRAKPFMAKHFGERKDFLQRIASDKPVYKDAVRLLGYESQTGLWSLVGLVRMYLKYRHTLFYTYEKDPVAFVRALLHPFMMVYNYRHLLERHPS